MAQVDDYRDAILEAIENGAPMEAIAITLGFPPTTVRAAVQRWNRPARPSPGDDALERLRALVEE